MNVLSIDTDYVTSNVHFNNIINYFLNYVDDVELQNIIFSQAHSNIFYILDPIFRDNKSVDIVNIDHHHDIWYPESPKNSFNSSNWLGFYLEKKKCIDNVYWLANHNSDRTNHDDWVTITYDINEVKFSKFDYIFVCNSPNFSNSLSEAAFSALINIVMHTKKCKKFDFFRPNLANHITKGIITNE
jgi:hypothetical protein